MLLAPDLLYPAGLRLPRWAAGNLKCQLLGKQGVRRTVEATAWMSLICICSPAYPPVRTEQKRRLKDGKGGALLQQQLWVSSRSTVPLALVLASVLCATGGGVLEGSPRNVIEMGEIPSLRSALLAS